VRAARTALTVGGAILVGAALAAVVRIALPRALGPTVYGGYRLAESAAEVVLLLLTLGLDTTLRRDIAHAPATAAQRLWDVVGLRTRSAVVIASLGGLLLVLGGASARVLTLYVGFAAVQSLLAVANAHVAALHATGDARWPSRLGVALRAAWTLVALGLLAVGWHPLWLVGALLGTESVRVLLLQRRSVQRFGAASAVAAFSWSRAGVAAAASLAVFVNYLAHNLYARLGTWVLGVRVSADAVAWYASAANVAALALLGMPLVTWVLLPSAAGASRAGTGRDTLMVAALRAALLGAVPVAGVIVWAADPLVGLLFGSAFAPAVPALRLLAPTIALAYLATIAAVALLERGRERHVALVSVGGLVVATGLTLQLVAHAPEGQAASAAALAMLGTELTVTVAMLALAWRRVWTAPLLRTAAGVGLALVVALAAAQLAATLGVGLLLRGTLLAFVYAVTLPLVGAVRRTDLDFVRTVLRRAPTDVH